MVMLQKPSFRIYLSKLVYFLVRHKFKLIAVCLAPVLFLVILLISELLVIKTVVVQNPSFIPVRGIPGLYKRNILLTSDNDINKYLRSLNPHVSSVNIVREYPSTLYLTFSYLSPVAQVKMDKGVLVVAESGRVLQKNKTYVSALPTISFYQVIRQNEYMQGDTIEYDEIVKTLQLITAVNSYGVKIDTVDIGGPGMIACKVVFGWNQDSKPTIYFSFEKDVSKQLYEMKKVVEKLRTDRRSIKSLDLRFNRPVIRF